MMGIEALIKGFFSEFFFFECVRVGFYLFLTVFSGSELVYNHIVTPFLSSYQDSIDSALSQVTRLFKVP